MILFQTAQASLLKHDNNTRRVVELKTFVEAVSATETSVVATADETKLNASDSLNRAESTLNNATALEFTSPESVENELQRANNLNTNAQRQVEQVSFTKTIHLQMEINVYFFSKRYFKTKAFNNALMFESMDYLQPLH